MRDIFPAFYPPTGDELADIWQNGIIVLDTNSLFHLLRYTESTREDFLKTLRAKSDQLWIPHQVAYEFQGGRLEMIYDQKKVFATLSKNLTELKVEFEKRLDAALASVTQHPTLDNDRLRGDLDKAYSGLNEVVEQQRQDYIEKVVDSRRHEITTDEIDELYTGRVGVGYSAGELDDIYAAGKRRYESRTPPGFSDASKGEPGMYGDWVIWSQMLAKGEAERKPMLFVSDDLKEDWIRHVRGEKKGPHPALIDEYYASAGERIHFMTPWAFIRHAQEVDTSITEKTVREVEAVSEAVAKEAAVRSVKAGRSGSPTWLAEFIETPDDLRQAIANLIAANETLRSALQLSEFTAKEIERLESLESLTQDQSRELRLALDSNNRHRRSIRMAEATLTSRMDQLRDTVEALPSDQGRRIEVLELIKQMTRDMHRPRKPADYDADVHRASRLSWGQQSLFSANEDSRARRGSAPSLRDTERAVRSSTAFLEGRERLDLDGSLMGSDED